VHHPPRRRPLPPALPALAAALALAACRVDAPVNPFPPPTLNGIVVSPARSEVQVGDTVRLNAIGTLSGLLGAFSFVPLDGAPWAVSDPAVARVEPLPTRPPTDSTRRAEALVRGLQPGTVRVTVSALGIEGSAEVRVAPGPAGARGARLVAPERP